jgi:hypothetical protein
LSIRPEGRRARTRYLPTIVGLLLVAHPAVAADIKSDPVPQTDGRVSAIVVSGDTVYIGGSFTHVDGVPHSRLAAVDKNTGAVDDSWNHSADLQVFSLAVLGDRLYVGGKFRVVNRSTRSNLAAVDKNTGQLTNWNPEANGNIRTLVPSPNGNRIYVGGNFSSINGKPRPNLAALNPTTGSLRGWTPDPKIDNDYEVFDLDFRQQVGELLPDRVDDIWWESGHTPSHGKLEQLLG